LVCRFSVAHRRDTRHDVRGLLQEHGMRPAFRWSWRFAASLGLSVASQVCAAERIGVVLLHGKQSAPVEHEPLANAIAAAGFLVERPEMCWSNRRIYDRGYLDCLRDIDAAVRRLKERGATSFVIAGHSLGANGALGYGARNQVRGVIALAPGHTPEFLAVRPPIVESLDRARQLLAAGRGDQNAKFADFNGTLAIRVTSTPAAYLSFFAPNSPALMPANAARLSAPLLQVSGSHDPFQRGPAYIIAKAPAHPLNRFAVVEAGHFDTSAESSSEVVAWLRRLAPP
jgi:pimeloyl-ACP methyl ester carboxylesterase